MRRGVRVVYSTPSSKDGFLKQCWNDRLKRERGRKVKKIKKYKELDNPTESERTKLINDGYEIISLNIFHNGVGTIKHYLFGKDVYIADDSNMDKNCDNCIERDKDAYFCSTCNDFDKFISHKSVING